MYPNGESELLPAYNGEVLVTDLAGPEIFFRLDGEYEVHPFKRGRRYQVVVFEIDNSDELRSGSSNTPREFRTKEQIWDDVRVNSVCLCKEAQFQEWVTTKPTMGMLEGSPEEKAADYTRMVCNIDSRGELAWAGREVARQRFQRMKQEFYNWRDGGGAPI